MRPDRTTQIITTALVAACLLGLIAGSARAQSGGGSGGLLETVRSDEILSELNLTDEQVQKIEEMAGQSGDRSTLRELFRKSREAKTEEERAAIREEMAAAIQQRQKETNEKLKAILTESQMTRVQQLSLRERGARALGESEVAESLSLSEEQRQSVGKLINEREAARRELGFGVSDEEQEKFNAEWDGKLTAVLTPEQQQEWQQRLGPPIGESDTPAAASATPVAERRAAFEVDVPQGADAVASFNARADSPANNAGAAPNKNEPTLSFNFRYAPWDVVLQRFAEVAGLTLDLKDVPPGTFNHFDQSEYTITEALDVINSYLLRRGYVLVRGDGFLVSLNIDDGIPPNLVPTIEASELYDRGRYELLTVVFPLPGANVTEVAAEIEKLKGPQGTVVGMSATNSLSVTDIGINLRRIQSLLSNVAPGSEDMIFKPYSLNNIAADEAELLIKQMLGVTTGVTNVSSGSSSRDRDRDSRSRFDWFRRGRDNDDDDSRNNTATVNLSRARIVADPRTNRLLATASPSEHRIIEEAVKTIDVEATGSFLSKQPYLFTYEVTNADSREVTKTIDAIMPGVVVNEDGRNDLIHIMGTPEQHEKVRDLIQRMDGAGGGSQVAVIPLSHMDPGQAVVTLQGMFLRDGTDAPTIQPDLLGRQVMVRGTQDQIIQIRQILNDLGEDGTGTARAGRGPLRTFNLSGRDPAEILPIIQQMWKMRNGNSINVVNPPGTSRGGPRVLDGDPAVGEESPAPIENQPPVQQEAQGEEPDRLGARRQPEADPYAVSVEDEPAESEVSESGNDSPTSSDESFTAVEEPVSPIDVQVTGGDLLLFSEDEEALNELERMLETVLQRFPPRTTWTVIPLRSADATETAAMLGKLFPDSSVSQSAITSSGLLGTLTSGVTSFGSSVGEMTGLNTLGTGPQTLHIIPEIRLNALFVSGPTYRVKEVRDMLEVLDASGLTDSLRDRVPRMIPVRYAEIGEVYEMVKSVYEPELQARSNGGNPAAGLAAMFGGGRGRRGNDDDDGSNAEPQVTLGVDRVTSNLIVSADESTFVEIEQLVESIDTAARDARRTVQVLSLENVNASLVQDSLTSLMPKVTVSTTSTTPRSNGSSSSRSNDSDSSSSDADALRQRMEIFRRMREGREGSSGGRDNDDNDGDRGRSFFGRGGFGGRGFGGRGGDDDDRRDRGRGR